MPTNKACWLADVLVGQEKMAGVCLSKRMRVCVYVYVGMPVYMLRSEIRSSPITTNDTVFSSIFSFDVVVILTPSGRTAEAGRKTVSSNEVNPVRKRVTITSR